MNNPLMMIKFGNYKILFLLKDFPVTSLYMDIYGRGIFDALFVLFNYLT